MNKLKSSSDNKHPKTAFGNLAESHSGKTFTSQDKI